jgi:glucokinase
MRRKFFIGVDIGGTKTAIVLSSRPPLILDRIQFPTCASKPPQFGLKKIVEGIRKVLSAHGVRLANLQSIGVSCGSPLDPVDGVILGPPNLPNWQNVPIKSILTREFGVDCFVENDANAGALAEHHFGAGQGTRNLVFLTMGTGLGAGMILDGRLYRGSSYAAGEIGHIRLTRSGPIGYHKAGSAEGWASGAGMPLVAGRLVKAALRHGEKTVLARSLRGTTLSLSARDIWNAAQAGDAVSKRIVRITGERLGEAIAVLIDLINPECIVVGGLAVRMGGAILGPARSTAQREALRSSAEACKIVPATLGEHIGDIAALCIAMGEY